MGVTMGVPNKMGVPNGDGCPITMGVPYGNGCCGCYACPEAMPDAVAQPVPDRFRQ